MIARIPEALTVLAALLVLAAWALVVISVSALGCRIGQMLVRSRRGRVAKVAEARVVRR
jgi:hypothetical protein